MMGGAYQSTLREGQTAPDVQLRTLDGGAARLSELAAQGPVLLAFYKDTCPVCQLTLPFLNRARQGQVSIYAVSQDNVERTGAFARDFGIEFGLLVDPADGYTASNAFGITHVPSMFVIDPDLTVRWTSSGFMKVDIESLEAITGTSILTEADDVPLAKPG
jgi:peroxiredoxin